MCKCIKTTIKALLFGFNAILLLIALALLGIGIYCEVVGSDMKIQTNQTIAENTNLTEKPDALDQSTESTINATDDTIAEEVKNICFGKSPEECRKIIFATIRSGGLILIIVSAVIVIITVLGMCGASNQNKCLLGIYFALILILLIAVAIGTILTQTKWLEDLVQKVVDNNVIPAYVKLEIFGIIKTISGFSLWVLIALMVVLVLNLVFACFFCKRVKDDGDFGPI